VIVVISHTTDEPARDACTRLRARGEEVLWFDPRTIGKRTQLSFEWDAGGTPRHWICVDDRRVELEGVGAIWYRKPGQGGREAPSRFADFIDMETDHALHHLGSELGVPFVPGPRALLLAWQDKLRQLQLAGSVGFEVPPTLVTNEPARLLEFWRSHGGKCVTKLLAARSLGAPSLGGQFTRFTEPVTHRDLAAFESIASCPTFVQAYVPKRLELRVTVVGGRVLAAEIHSQASAHGRHDWRKYDLESTPYLAHELPVEIERQCLALVRAIGLHYAALDLVLTPDGRYVFLEVNPGGEYHWIEKRTGLPITDALCDLLIALAHGRNHA